MWYREITELIYWEKTRQIDEKQMLVAAVMGFCIEIWEDSLLFSRPGLAHTHTHTLVII